MNCPQCKSDSCRRSRRRTLADHLFGIVGVLPWRCNTCHARFHARVIPAAQMLYARCAICGNMDLQRISPDKVLGATAVFGRTLGLPSLRCEPCRNKFFSLRPLLRTERPGGRDEIPADDSAAKY